MEIWFVEMGGSLINLEEVQALRPMNEDKTHVYLHHREDYLVVNEPYKNIVEKIR